jgi:hypothetical protein
LPHGSSAGELEKLRNRTEGLVSKADYQKDLKKLKSALTKEMDEKIEEVGACLPLCSAARPPADLNRMPQ